MTLASTLAGPTFLVLLAFAGLVDSIPNAVDIWPRMFPFYFFTVVMSAGVGFLPAFVACLLGRHLLTAAARHLAWAALPEIWVVAGAALVAVPAWLAGAPPLLCFALGGTGAWCAFLVHPSCTLRAALQPG
ncbi:MULTISPECIES: hypothetical protein [Sphingomonas]|uniref:hypothetical protein n=1 Tax=Sphingomonas TaxID=13687 RepID=UPI000DEF991B|nr:MULTISPECIES: hypothetical protein [Sphingomonas]